MLVIFTDLDGTLLDHRSYASEAAGEALEQIRNAGIPLVFTTSKTRAEVEFWREKLGNADPYIVENGGAAIVPRGYFPVAVPEVTQFGDDYASLVRALAFASRESGVAVRGFHEMTTEEVAAACDLPLDQARLAKQREYDEPFVVRGEGDPHRLTQSIEARGKLWTRGGRFYHIMGNNDKAAAVKYLTGHYRRTYGGVRTIGAGDGWNDVSFLHVVDFPVLICPASDRRLRSSVPGARVPRSLGPAGWNEAVLELLAELTSLMRTERQFP
ncbi:MAG: HAD-IIB family hydrolase [Bryobacteraceae bacterium]